MATVVCKPRALYADERLASQKPRAVWRGEGGGEREGEREREKMKKKEYLFCFFLFIFSAIPYDQFRSVSKNKTKQNKKFSVFP